MIILLTNIQRGIITLAMIIVFSISIYIFWNLIKKEVKRSKEAQYLSMDSIISLKRMKKLINYTIGQGEMRRFSLLMITIDQFDQIMDFANSRTTSEYLQHVGRLLEISLPLGGKLCQTEDRDSFLIFLYDAYDQSHLLEAAKRFKMMAERRVEMADGSRIEKSVSIAMIQYPEQGHTFEQLYNHLETATYAIKKQGGNDIRLYNVDMIEEKKNFKSYKELKTAIKTKQLKTVYIPYYDPLTSFMSGVEVDCLWDNGEHILRYRDFMPNLEATNDSYWFALWMLENALLSHVSMIGINTHQKYHVVVPVGVRQFENGMIADDLIHILDKYMLHPEQLILKIINPLQVNHETQFIKSLLDLQGYGVRLALDVKKIDDNLYYLITEYKIEVLLIDQVLLMREHGKGLEVDELVKFAKANDISMVATYVNDARQIANLDDNIVHIQGQLCGVDLDRSQILTRLNKRLEEI